MNQVLAAAVEKAIAAGKDPSAASEARLREIVEKLNSQLADSEHKWSEVLSEQRAGFQERLAKRWQPALNLLHMFRDCTAEAAVAFQAEALRHSLYETDYKLGALLRLHARGCRIVGEVIALMESGYADGALARWRSIHELAVVAILLSKSGREVSESYLLAGEVQAIRGMVSYQETAEAMGREPYSKEEMEAALARRDAIFADQGKELGGRNGWALKHFKSGRIEKLQELVGLSKWANDVMLASRDVHADYREMQSLMAMSSATEELLLAGPSDHGLAEAGHRAALSMNMITGSLLTCDAEDQESPIDYGATAVFLPLLERHAEEIGVRLLAATEARAADEAS